MWGSYPGDTMTISPRARAPQINGSRPTVRVGRVAREAHPLIH